MRNLKKLMLNCLEEITPKTTENINQWKSHNLVKYWILFNYSIAIYSLGKGKIETMNHFNLTGSVSLTMGTWR